MDLTYSIFVRPILSSGNHHIFYYTYQWNEIHIEDQNRASNDHEQQIYGFSSIERAEHPNF